MPAFSRPLRRLALLIALVLILLTSSLAQAGGWFVVTLDALPASPVAGETMTIGFMVRSHGTHPGYWDGLSIVARNPTTGMIMRVAPRQQGPIGHYTADIAFPDPGSWEWGIDIDQIPWVRWAPLTVLPAPITAPTVEPSSLAAFTPSSWLPLVLALTATGLFLAALQVGRRRALGPALGLAAAVGALALVLTLATTPQAVATASAPPAESDANNLIAEGRALFLAKGCVTCHIHAQAAANGFESVSIGPVLSRYAAPADSPFLRQWLANPASLRPETRMPNLDLNDREIESLIAFLGSSAQSQ